MEKQVITTTKTIEEKTTILHNVTENDILDVFNEAISQTGVRPGDIIPTDMIRMKQLVVKILFDK